MTSDDAADPADIDSLLDGLSDRELVGQLVMGHPQYLSVSERRRLFGELGVGSAIVRTPTNPAYAAAFTARLGAFAAESGDGNGNGVPLLIGGDFAAGTAGGIPLVTEDDPLAGTDRVRTQGTTAFPQHMALGATRCSENTARVARITARELRAMGYHWNFAPTADVNVDPRNPVIGVRSFGENPDVAATHTAAYVDGSQKNARTEGVIATAKHFPGHGNTTTDSHLSLPTVADDRERIEEVHLPPFEAAIDAGVDAIMPAHVVVEALDPDRPATLSRPVLTDLLRDELGFDKVVITDSMAMGAIEKRWGRADAAIEAISAGADVVLAVAKGDDPFTTQVTTVNGLYDAYRSGRLSERRVREAAGRVLRLKRDYGLFERSAPDPLEATRVVGRPAHREEARTIARRSITLVRNDGVLPFDADSTETTLVVGFTPALDGFRTRIEKASVGPVVGWRSRSLDPSPGEIETVTRLAGAADRVVVATWSGRGAPRLPHGQAALLAALADCDVSVVAIASELPYDVGIYSRINAALAAYAGHHGPKARPLRAAAAVLFGAAPEGRLPVTVGDRYAYGHGLAYEPTGD